MTGYTSSCALLKIVFVNDTCWPVKKAYENTWHSDTRFKRLPETFDVGTPFADDGAGVLGVDQHSKFGPRALASTALLGVNSTIRRVMNV
jgi:hypothetical protein